MRLFILQPPAVKKSSNDDSLRDEGSDKVVAKVFQTEYE